MNRNTESYFSNIPQAQIQRSVMNRDSTVKLSGNVGDLIPFYIDEILPGDSCSIDTSMVVRLQTLLTPIMDNVYADTYYFFVPSRLCWQHWKEFMGENTQSAWVPETEYFIPKFLAVNGVDVGSVADYLGIPPGVKITSDTPRSPMKLPFNAYSLVYDSFFRDQNWIDPPLIDTSDSSMTYDVDNPAKGGRPYKVAKFHDYFTSVLPAPLKADNPVSAFDLQIYNKNGIQNSPYYFPVVTAPFLANTGTTPIRVGLASNTSSLGGYMKLTTDDEPLLYDAQSGNAKITNMWADLQNFAAAEVTINQLRLAFALQKYYERNAYGGSRYFEVLNAHFGVTSPDARLQRPEYLGGHRFPVTIHQITNQSESESAFLGNVGAMSVTTDVHEDFEKSFCEHGFCLGVMCLRYDHSYPQGLERFWSREHVEDYYWPVFANLGNQAVFEQEIMFQENVDPDAEVFGYQEAWAEYRYKPNRVAGELRPGVDNSLASWHLADYYTIPPYPSSNWINEDKTNVDRALAVTSAVANQFWCDILIANKHTRPMPMFSIPGLIDHN